MVRGCWERFSSKPLPTSASDGTKGIEESDENSVSYRHGNVVVRTIALYRPRSTCSVPYFRLPSSTCTQCRVGQAHGVVIQSMEW